MRVAVVEPNGQGGLIHYAYQLCTALAEAGTEVTLITARDYEMSEFPHNFQVEPRLNLWSLFDPESMTAHPGGHLAKLLRKTRWLARRVLRGARLVREWNNLTSHLIRQRPDVVQFGVIRFPFQTLFLQGLRQNGLILTQICHEFEHREGQGIIARITEQLRAGAYDQFSAIFFHAVQNRERFLSFYHVPQKATHVIPLGNEGIFLTRAARPVDLRSRYGLDESEPVVLFFGILAPSKGLPNLLAAFAQVIKRQPARLIIAGYPTKFIDVNELRGQAEQLGITQWVIFDTRYIPFEEVGALMELATVVVYPYRSSTQSAALQVAYAFGRPVIATQVGGLPEVVEDGRSGFLVPPENPRLLADKILTILSDASLAKQMGAYARHLSESLYSWRPIAEQILSVYNSLLANRARD